MDLVYGRTAISHLELVWEEPVVGDYFRELGAVARVILRDQRGVGLSDRTVGTATLEDRVLRTVVFAGIADSTKLASCLGDHAWRELLGSFLAVSKAEVVRFRGRIVKTTGDGFLAPSMDRRERFAP